MTSELHFQRKVVEAVEERGGYGFKMSHRFTSGIPDLLLALRPTTYVVEVKMVDLPARPASRLTTTLTRLQRHTLMSLMRAGGSAGLMMCHSTPAGDAVLCTRSLEAEDMPTRDQFLAACFTRGRGTALSLIIDQILAPLRPPPLTGDTLV